MKNYLTITQAAKMLGVSRPTIYSCIKKGKLKTMDNPVGPARIAPSSVDILLGTPGRYHMAMHGAQTLQKHYDDLINQPQHPNLMKLVIVIANLKRAAVERIHWDDACAAAYGVCCELGLGQLAMMFNEMVSDG